MRFKIVADSSSDVLSIAQAEYASVPLKITVGETTYVDDEAIDVEGMRQTLRTYKGRTTTACPSPEDWTTAFDNADRVFCVTITSTLSGCCNSARLAARDYEAAHPDRKVFVIDTLSAGPELALLVYKLEEMILAGLEYDDICRKITDYLATTKLMFVLRSIRNLANNGRVSPAVATLVGLLGIRIVGRASDRGDLQPMTKSRGDKRALADLTASMQELGYKGGRVLIHHCDNVPYAEKLRDKLLGLFPQADVGIAEAGGLCSYYAEDGGLLIGFETA